MGQFDEIDPQRRNLVAVTRESRTAIPEYELVRHWMRRRVKAQVRV